MAIQYGNEVLNSPSGYSTRGFRVYAEYYVTQSETSWYVQVRLGVQQVTGPKMSWKASRIYWSISGGGISTGTLGGTAVSLEDNQSKALTGYYTSYTYNRSTSAQSVSITCTLWANSPALWHGTSSTTLYFTIPARTSYAVTYNGNGATGGSTGTQYKYYDMGLALSNNGFTKTGYSFVNWNTLANPTVGQPGNSYNPGDSYNTNAPLALYAQWTPNSYTVTYHSNSGIGEMEDDTFYYDQSYNLSPCTFTKPDHLFAGWATSEGGAAVYQNEQNVHDLATTGTVHLYAVWQTQYTQPSFTEANGWRQGESISGSIIDDEAGNYILVSTKVTPALVRQILNGPFEYMTTKVSAGYKLSSASDSEYSWHPTVYEISEPLQEEESLTWAFNPQVITDGSFTPFDPEQQYDILVTAQGSLDGVDKTSAYNEIKTFVSTAEFALDINADGSSFGLFSIAPGTYIEEVGETNNQTTVNRVKTVSINGDLLLAIDENAGKGYIDNTLIQLLSGLGWGVTVNPQDVVQTSSGTES